MQVSKNDKLRNDTIGGEKSMKSYKDNGHITVQNDGDLREKIVKILIFKQFYNLMKEFYIDFSPEQYTNNQEYLTMSNILRESNEYLEHVNAAIWDLLIANPDKMIEISTECSKLCNNRFTEVAISSTPAKRNGKKNIR